MTLALPCMRGIYSDVTAMQDAWSQAFSIQERTGILFLGLICRSRNEVDTPLKKILKSRACAVRPRKSSSLFTSRDKSKHEIWWAPEPVWSMYRQFVGKQFKTDHGIEIVKFFNLYELKVDDDGNWLLKLDFWTLSIVPDCLYNFVVQTIWDDG
jgi:hypothetical protein